MSESHANLWKCSTKHKTGYKHSNLNNKMQESISKHGTSYISYKNQQ